jgi:hypothetical protein
VVHGLRWIGGAGSPNNRIEKMWVKRSPVPTRADMAAKGLSTEPSGSLSGMSTTGGRRGALAQAIGLVAVSVFGASASWAQSDVPPVVSAELGLSEAASVPVRLKTVIMGLKAQRGADASLCKSLERVVEGEVMADPQRDVMSRNELAQLMQLEAEKAAMGCEGDSCLAEIADALDADRIVSGTVDRLGSSYLVVLTELDARNVRVVGRVQKRLSTNEDRLFGGVEQMAQELVRKASADGVESGSLVVTASPPAEVFVDGESYGGSPAVIDGLDPGVVELELISGLDRVTVEAPVAYAKSTKVDAQIHLTKGPTIEEIQANAQAAFWGGVFSIGEILVGVPLLCGSPFCGCGGGVALAYVSGFGFNNSGEFAPQGSLTFWAAMSAIGIAVFSVATGLLGLSATTFVFGPDVPDMGEPEHKILITPPDGEGDPLRLKINAEDGAVEELPVEVDRPSSSPSTAAQAVDWSLKRQQTAMAH